MSFLGDIFRLPIRLSIENQRQIFGLAGLIRRDPAHSPPREADYRVACLVERAFSNPEDDFSDMQVVHQSVTRDNNGIAWLQPHLGPHIDSHVRRTEKIRHEVTFGVMQRFAFIEKAGFDGESRR